MSTNLVDKNIMRYFERKILSFIDKGIESPYVEYLIKKYEENDYEILNLLWLFDREDEKGDKDFFPMKYYLTYLRELKERNFNIEDQYLIGGWSVFFHIYKNKGLEAVKEFRGSHDLDQVGKYNTYFSLWKGIYPYGVWLDSHLPNKYSFYAEDPAIVKDGTQRKRNVELDFYYPNKNGKIIISDATYRFEDYKPEIITIGKEEIPIPPVELIIELKKYSNREKDVKDINILKELYKELKDHS